MGGTYRPPSESGLSVSSKSKRTTLNSTLFSFIFLFNIVLFFYITHMHQFSSACEHYNIALLFPPYKCSISPNNIGIKFNWKEHFVLGSSLFNFRDNSNVNQFSVKIWVTLRPLREAIFKGVSKVIRLALFLLYFVPWLVQKTRAAC